MIQVGLLTGGEVGYRNRTFAAMKGLAIASVVLGHCCPGANEVVGQYHLAVFFFVAGYFFKESYLEMPRRYILKRIQRLYVPFVEYGVVLLLLHNVLTSLHIYENVLTTAEILRGGVKLVVGLTSSESLMGAMWFCPALLFVSIYSYLMLWLTRCRSIYVRTILFLGAMCLGAVCCHYRVKSPYCLWQYLQICSIFYMGFLFRRYEGRLENPFLKGCIAILSAGVVWATTHWDIYAQLQPANITKENPLALLLIAWVGCMGVYCVASLLRESNVGRLLAVVGDYSFSIMALHFLCFKLVNLIQCVWYGFPLERVSDFPFVSVEGGWWLAYLLVGISLSMFLSWGYGRGMEKLRVYVRHRSNRL